MGTEKRERQKQARQEKIEELRRSEQRSAKRRKGLLIGAAIVAFLAFAIGFSVLSSDGDEDVETAADDTAADDGDDPTVGDSEDDEPSGDPAEAAEPLPCPGPDGADERVTEFPAPPPMCIDPETDYTATMVTDVGTIEFDLLEDEAPNTVNNFVYLTRYQYYDGITFHRVIPGFVVQGGDPEGTGAGGPGYQIDDELPEPDDYQAGSLAMANAGPDTNGSQFFIVTSDEGAQTLVDAVGGEAAYSLFGQVTSGMDVVEQIEADGSPAGSPQVVHTIESVTIHES